MPAIRFAVVLLIGLVFTSFLADHVQAQDPLDPIQNQLPQLLPATENGTPITDAQRIWAYAAAIVGFIVVFGVAWFGVRLFAFLVVIAAFFGGIALACLTVREKAVTTWEQLAVVVLYLGCSAGIAAITANLYLLKGGVDDKK